LFLQFVTSHFTSNYPFRSKWTTTPSEWGHRAFMRYLRRHAFSSGARV